MPVWREVVNGSRYRCGREGHAPSLSCMAIFAVFVIKFIGISKKMSFFPSTSVILFNFAALLDNCTKIQWQVIILPDGGK